MFERAVIMCGRFTGFRQKEELLAYFPIDAAEIEVAANYNVAPSQPIPVIVRRDGRNHLETYHWGLVPFWARDPSVGSRLINARVELLTALPARVT